MDHEKEAKELLTYYLRKVWEKAGLNWNADNQAEAEGIADHLIEAACDRMEERERERKSFGR